MDPCIPADWKEFSVSRMWRGAEYHIHVTNPDAVEKGVKSVTGLGLMLGVETERPVKDVISECMARGVLVISAKNKVRLLPALNIPMAQLEQAVSVLKDVCAGE